MTTTLLHLALTLLMAVQTNPHVTPEMRTHAISVANLAISMALAEQSSPAAGTPIAVPIIQVEPLPPAPAKVVIPSCKMRTYVNVDNTTVTIDWDTLDAERATLFWSDRWGEGLNTKGGSPKHTMDGTKTSGTIVTNAEWSHYIDPNGYAYNGQKFVMQVYSKDGSENACTASAEQR